MVKAIKCSRLQQTDSRVCGMPIMRMLNTISVKTQVYITVFESEKNICSNILILNNEKNAVTGFKSKMLF